MKPRYEPDHEHHIVAPKSAFYRGRNQSRRTNSFKPTHETQAEIDRQRHQQERRKNAK